jgi:hypothetical protein
MDHEPRLPASTEPASQVVDDLRPLLLALGDSVEQWPTQAPSMASLEAIEADMLRYPQAVIPVQHTLLPGLYARRIEIPADCRLIGKVQKHPHLNILLEGDITFMVNGVVQRVTAGWQGVIPGGTKKIGYTHAKTVWMTVHPNPGDETDIKALEDQIVTDTFSQYLEFIRALPLTGEPA